MEHKPSTIEDIKYAQIPTSIAYESFVLGFYLQVLDYLIDSDFGEEQIKTAPANHCEMFAVHTTLI